MNNSKIQSTYFFLVLFLLIGLNVYLLSPIFGVFMFSAIIASTFWPLHVYIKTKTKVSENNAAILTTLFISLVIVVPIVLLLIGISKELITFYQMISTPENISNFKADILSKKHLTDHLLVVLDKIGISVTMEDIINMILSKVQGVTGHIFKWLNGLLGSGLNFIFQLILLIMMIYSFFSRGTQLKEYVFAISPLPSDVEELLLSKFNQMNYVTLICNGLGGVIQGLIGGLTMLVLGFGSMFLWTTLMIVLAFIPLVGISFITVPAAIYLLLKGSIASGLILVAVTIVTSTLVENWFKPAFIGKKIKVDSMLMLFYIIAGMMTFGMAGIFYGPVICVVLMTIFEILRTYYTKSLD
ncbi:AI-2E family transporter [Bacteriovorax sp. Seq25_V]|uniref:AI-2E family transporter n=1 Tax=Bacteriovorax sp. Seq25_V TaxID=1201288 RepID=UPI00038A0AF4|nr:AI-2E family transporter [Bacteriovorax sp. Seq25_V]EQC44868.1 PF01594 domain protein [Bacteriovorax sp. Seq25_V]